MASRYINGIGLVTVSPKKSSEEIVATLDYYQNIAPKYQELGGFSSGFNDTQSIIYRWWENLHKTEDEEKDTWFKQEVEEWGQMVGYTDSQALSKYYEDIEEIRPLTTQEAADRDANHGVMVNFQADMYDAYDNHDGDISEVQKKYGYEEEELGVLNGLYEFGKLAVTEPTYMLGSLAGMVAKDPELLLLGMLRIPAMAAQATTRAAQLASMAIKIQPKYVQSLSKAIQGNRGRAVIGRGAEGATYAGTYEALHDLTFKGHIKKENVERGLALGALLGSAFGAVSKSTGGKSWLLARQGSLNAEKQMAQLKYSLHDPNLKWRKAETIEGESVLSFEQGWQKKLDNLRKANKGWVWNTETKKFDPPAEPKGGAKPVDPLGQEVANVKFRETPEQAKLPEGLTHKARYDMWRQRAIDIIKAETTLAEGISAEAFVDKIINKERTARKMEKGADGKSPLFTGEEASGLAAKDVAWAIENQKYGKKFIEKEARAKDTPKGETPAPELKGKINPKWGNRREKALGAENLTEVRGTKDFRNIHRIDDAELPVPTLKQKLVGGGIVGGLGYYISEEDKALGGVLGLAAGFVARGHLKGINRSKALLRLQLYKAMGASEGIAKGLQTEAGKTVQVLAQVLKGKNPELSSIDFLTYLEHWSQHSYKPKGSKVDYGAVGRKKLSPEMQNAMKSFRGVMEDFRVIAQKHGVLGEEQFIQDYVSHLFRNKKQTPQSIHEFKQKLNNSKNKSQFEHSSRFNKIRTLVEDIQTLAKENPDLETDVFKIIDAYTRSMSKAIAGRNLINVLEKEGIAIYGKAIDSTPVGILITKGEMNRVMLVDGKKWTMKDFAIEKLGYKTSNHPALRGKLIHPLMKNAIDDFFAPEMVGDSLLNKSIIVNNAMKRIAVSFSFFHAQALVLSAAYSGMIGELATAAGRQRLRDVRRIMKGEWEHYTDKDGKVITKKNIHGRDAQGELVGASLLQEMAEAGVEIGVKASEFVDPGFNTVTAFLQKRAPLAAKGQAFIDKWTWDKFHDVSKAFTYLTMKQRMMSTTPRGIGKIMPYLSKIRGKDLGKWKALNEAEAREVAASFVNDAYGGQRHAKLALEWQKKAIENADNPKGEMYQWLALWTTPSKAKLSNLLLFSPDWTISNLRIGFRGMGMTKDLFGKIAKGEKFTPKEMAEWNVYMGYWVRALATTSALAYIMHSWLGDEDSELDLQDFWYTGRLDLGTGEEIVVSKQIAEPLHWLVNPAHTALNKSASLPKMGLELLLGKEWVSLKHGDSDRLFFRGGSITGKTRKTGDASELAWWASSKVTPISFNRLRQAIRDEKELPHALKSTATGMFGFPFYGTKR